MRARIHITGASGSGTSTLGRCLADDFGVPQLDTDDYYWAPSDLPFTARRPAAERLALMRQACGSGGWVISGSCDGWGDPLVLEADLIVFLTLPTPLRLARLKRRERRLFDARIGPGGDMERNHRDFLTWAASYDRPYFSGRSLNRHENWLAGLRMPVLRMRGDVPCGDMVSACRAAIETSALAV